MYYYCCHVTNDAIRLAATEREREIEKKARSSGLLTTSQQPVITISRCSALATRIDGWWLLHADFPLAGTQPNRCARRECTCNFSVVSAASARMCWINSICRVLVIALSLIRLHYLSLSLENCRITGARATFDTWTFSHVWSKTKRASSCSGSQLEVRLALPFPSACSSFA